MIRLDGKKVSESLKQQLEPRIEKITKTRGWAPHLVVVLVGDDPASQVYVRNKQLACEKLGMKSTLMKKPATLSQAELEKIIVELNQDSKVDGILVQMPLPQQLNADRVFELISPAKDADGFSYFSTGLLWSGKAIVKPCTPAGVIEILKFYKIPLKGKKVTVVGRSHIVGKPLVSLLLEEDASVSVVHSKTENTKDYTLQSDVVIVAAGKAGLLGKEDFKKDSVVIDVGMHGTGRGQLRGDVRFEELENWCSAVTPVPGGVGPMTIAMLLQNTVLIAEDSMKSGAKK